LGVSELAIDVFRPARRARFALHDGLSLAQITVQYAAFLALDAPLN
jgi:hypothetical protein